MGKWLRQQAQTKPYFAPAAGQRASIRIRLINKLISESGSLIAIGPCGDRPAACDLSMQENSQRSSSSTPPRALGQREKPHLPYCNLLDDCMLARLLLPNDVVAQAQ